MPFQKENIRDAFMNAFVKQLLINSYDPTKERLRNKLKEIEQVELLGIKPKMKVKKIPFKRSILHRNHQSIPKTIAIPKRSKIPSAIRSQMPTPPMSNVPQVHINLGKLTNFLNDPSVLGIESPGPGKNILVNRSGAIQATPIIMSKEEIDSIMSEVSDKTRIPIVPGAMFKAAFQDLVLTAVISDYIGTRFMIQKMNPFQQSY